MAADRREQIPGWKRDFRLFLSAPIPAVLLRIIHKDQGTWITLWGWSWRSLLVWGWQDQDPTWNIKYSKYWQVEVARQDGISTCLMLDFRCGFQSWIFPTTGQKHLPEGLEWRWWWWWLLLLLLLYRHKDMFLQIHIHVCSVATPEGPKEFLRPLSRLRLKRKLLFP